MNNDSLNRMKQEERERERARRSEAFWQAFSPLENGRVKSALLLYSFCLCFVFLAVYGLLYFFLMDPLHALFAGAPPALENLAEAVIPAAAGAAVCSLAWFLSPDKRLLSAAYGWMAALALAALLAMLISLWGEREPTLLFLQFYGSLVIAPLILGGGSALLLLRRHTRRRRQTAGEKLTQKRL